jgi:hypothetical protein
MFDKAVKTGQGHKTSFLGPGKPFKPSQTFNSSAAPLKWSYLKVGSCPYLQILNQAERIARDKQPNLFGY